MSISKIIPKISNQNESEVHSLSSPIKYTTKLSSCFEYGDVKHNLEENKGEGSKSKFEKYRREEKKKIKAEPQRRLSDEMSKGMLKLKIKPQPQFINKKRLGYYLEHKIAYILIVLTMLGYLIIMEIDISLEADGDYYKNYSHRIKYFQICPLLILLLNVILNLISEGTKYANNSTTVLEIILLVIIITCSLLEIILKLDKTVFIFKLFYNYIKIIYSAKILINIYLKGSISKFRKEINYFHKNPVTKLVHFCQIGRNLTKIFRIEKESAIVLKIIEDKNLFEPNYDIMSVKKMEKLINDKKTVDALEKTEKNNSSQKKIEIIISEQTNNYKRLIWHPDKITALKTLDNFDFDIFAYSEANRDMEIYTMGLYLFDEYQFEIDLMIAYEKFDSFMYNIQIGYDKTNPYHNPLHAADVMQTMNFVVKSCDYTEYMLLDKLDIFLHLFCAAVHDYSHPGPIMLT